MTRVGKQFSGWLLFYIVLFGAESLNKTQPFPHGIGDFLPHLMELAQFTLGGLVMMWVFREVFEETAKEHMAPAIRDGFDTLTEHVERSLEAVSKEHISPALHDGLQTLASEMSLRTQLEVSPGVIKQLQALVDTTFDHLINTPQVRSAVNMGNYTEAMNKAKDEDEEMAVILKSDDEEDWRKGFTLANKMANPNPVYYVTLAFRFWSRGEMGFARSVAEAGLERVKQQKNTAVEAKLKNTLAFIYAEQKDLEYEEKARAFAEEALAESPESEFRLDTKSFVLLSFARDEKDISEGVKLATQAWERGLPIEDYTRSVILANEQTKRLAGRHPSTDAEKAG